MSIDKDGIIEALKVSQLDLRAENARLQERVREAEKERDWLMRMPLNERIDALVVELDRYKAQSEQRGEALEWDRWLIAMLVATEYTQHAEGCPREWDKECECWMAQVFTAAEARAAIDVTPEQAGEKERR